MSKHWGHTQQQSKKPPKKDPPKNIAYPIVPGQDMDERLYNYLSHATPWKHEQVLHKFLPRGYVKDKMGNLVYFRGKAKDHGTIFSCHMDTVHAEPIQVLPHLTKKGFVFGFSKKDKALIPCVLGADDKLGMYVMTRLLEANVPGVYIFHVGEESGGKGSEFIAAENKKLFKNIKRAIAFDRKGYKDIITSQRGGVCASQEFAKALAAQLNVKMPPASQYRGDPTGTFTDTANYAKLVPECSNLSVGYFDQHSNREHFDLYWLENMFLPAVLNVQWSELPATRDHTYVPPAYTPRPYVSQTNYSYGSTGSYQQRSLPLSKGLEAYNKVTFNTPWKDLPEYDADDQGIIDGVNDASMRALVYHYIRDISNSEYRVAYVLHKVMSMHKATTKALENKVADYEKLFKSHQNLEERLIAKTTEYDLVAKERQAYKNLYEEELRKQNVSETDFPVN